MLSDNIKKFRTEKGLSQENLAERLNVVRQTVSKWEKGLSVPDSDMLVKISEALETPVGVLLGEKPKHTENSAGIEIISAKLEMLEAVLEKKNENRRRVLRVISIIILTAAAVLLIFALAAAVHPLLVFSAPAYEGTAGEAVIWGADAPTAIYVTGSSFNIIPLIILAAAAAVSVIGIIKTKKK